jgi:hypothetical protein
VKLTAEVAGSHTLPEVIPSASSYHEGPTAREPVGMRKLLQLDLEGKGRPLILQDMTEAAGRASCNLQISTDRSHLIQCVDSGGQAAMHTEDLVVNDG